MKIDLSSALKASLDRTIGEARALEGERRPADAAAAYFQAAKLMQRFADYALTRHDQIRRLHKARGYAAHASTLRQQAATTPPAAEGPRMAGRPAPTPTADEYAQTIAGMIHRSSVSWDQIGGLETTKRDIKFAYGLALARKPEGLRLGGWRRVLFYGPPGTGKTLIAAATCHGLGATFFNVKANNVLSKFFGESSRLISALFEAARSEADEGFVVVFIDEVDSLCLSRGAGADSGAERRVLATLLSELDGLAHKGEDHFVLTIAATNAPWDLDEAVLSRFQKRIHIPLPDLAARRAILDILLTRQGHRLGCSLDDVAHRAEWFSGRDLERLCAQAVGAMIEQLNGDIPAVVDRGRDAITGHLIKVQPLDLTHFDAAFAQIHVDVAHQRELDERYREFASRN